MPKTCRTPTARRRSIRYSPMVTGRSTVGASPTRAGDVALDTGFSEEDGRVAPGDPGGAGSGPRSTRPIPARDRPDSPLWHVARVHVNPREPPRTRVRLGAEEQPLGHPFVRVEVVSQFL